MRLFEGGTASEVWQQALEGLYTDSDAQVQASRGGMTRELLHAGLVINDPRQRWVLTRWPPVNPAFAIAEVIWILRGRNDSGFLNFWNTKLPEYAGNVTVYHGAYGNRLRRHFGVDQLERAYHALSNNSETRQVVLQIWDAVQDLPDESGQPVSSDIPCNIAALLKVRGSKLEWMQIMRSNDIFRGTPYNFIQFTTIQEVLAGWLGLELGPYHHLSDSLHLYEKDEKQISVDTTVTVPGNSDSLCLSKEESEAVIAELSNHVDALLEPSLTRTELETIARQPQLPSAFRNLLTILLAEAARRRGWMDVTQDVIMGCTNPLLVEAWERWCRHLSASK